MNTEYEPIINNWYRHQDDHQHFCIIDIDEKTGLLEIQHANGDLDTMDIDTWYDANMILAQEPEWWSESVDTQDDDIDDSAADEDTYYWQEETAGNDDEQSPGERYHGFETPPEAIDERLIFGEWQEQDGENEKQYDMSETESAW